MSTEKRSMGYSTHPIFSFGLNNRGTPSMDPWPLPEKKQFTSVSPWLLLDQNLDKNNRPQIIDAIFAESHRAKKQKNYDIFMQLMESLGEPDFKQDPSAVILTLTITQHIQPLLPYRMSLAEKIRSSFEPYGGDEELDFIINGD